MSVGFGFSAGDFIAALQLVSTVIDALRDSGDSSTEYRALISQLFTLETALLRVKRLEVDDEQQAEYIALRQAACQCQRTIDAFWEKIKKYQPSLRTGGSGSRVRDGWRKIQWALCKKDDLVKFKADLVGHTESIELLLTTLHIGSTHIGRKSQEENHKSLSRKVQDSYFGCMQRLSQIMDRVTTGVEQGKRMLEMTAEVIQTNVQVFHIVLDIQSVITRIPGQVERQQPVYFVDALGRYTPFHLEFVLSAEALTHVLMSNFKSIGSGSEKIDRGEFAIQDTALKRDIDLSGPWESCFCPGQRVDMSMIFKSKKNPSHSCPACQHENSGYIKEDQDVECTNCGITFRKTIDEVDDDAPSPSSLREDSPSPQDNEVARSKRKGPEDEEEDMALFRRVRIKTHSEQSPGTLSREDRVTRELEAYRATHTRDYEVENAMKEVKLYRLDKEHLDEEKRIKKQISRTKEDSELEAIKKELQAYKRRDEEKARLMKEMEMKRLMVEKRSAEEKARFKKETEAAIEEYKIKIAEKAAKEKKEKARLKKEAEAAFEKYKIEMAEKAANEKKEK